MKKAIGVIIGLLVVVALALVIIPTTRDEIHWQWAYHKDETASYESYVNTWPAGRHSAEAQARYDEHGWDDAQAANTIRAYRQYSTTHSQGRHLQEAQTRATALRTDDTPFNAAIKTGIEASLEQFIADFPGHQREQDAQQALKDITEGRDIVDLLRDKKIEIETQGGGIQNVGVRVRRLVPYPITVRVPVGSYFVSARQSAQNMVTTAESKVRLASEDWQRVSVSAACANRSLDIPGGKDTFTVQRSPHQDELARLIPVLEKARVPFAVRQAAVWIVTDNADYDDLGILLSRPSFQMFGGTRQIKEPEAARAMRICSDAGIDIRKKAIWKGRETIYWGLKADDPSKNWLERQDPSLGKRAKQLVDEINSRLASVDKDVLAKLKAKRLSIYVGVAYGTKGPYAARIATFLRDQGHSVEVGTLTSGSPGVTVHFQEASEPEAKALSQLMEVLFGGVPKSGKIGKGGMSSDKDIVIWLR